MYKINIIKNNMITNSAQFTTEQLCLNFLNSNTLINAFGKNLREVYPMFNSNEYSEDISNAISQRTEIIDSNEVIIYTLPADYTYEILDITLQHQAEQESCQALQRLVSTDYKVLRHIRQQALNIPTTLTQEEYLTLEHQRNDASLKVI